MVIYTLRGCRPRTPPSPSTTTWYVHGGGIEGGRGPGGQEVRA